MKIIWGAFAAFAALAPINFIPLYIAFNGTPVKHAIQQFSSFLFFGPQGTGDWSSWKVHYESVPHRRRICCDSIYLTTIEYGFLSFSWHTVFAAPPHSGLRSDTSNVQYWFCPNGKNNLPSPQYSQNLFHLTLPRPYTLAHIFVNRLGLLLLFLLSLYFNLFQLPPILTNLVDRHSFFKHAISLVVWFQ